MAKEYLQISDDCSIYVRDGVTVEYKEGPQSKQAKDNQEYLKNRLQSGYLDEKINDSFLTDEEEMILGKKLIDSINELVGSITSEVGRAVVGLVFLQLTIKAIIPRQCVRLHKASQNRSSFSWVDGIAMRVIDKEYITPKLREHGLLKLNADGFMMTRSLAENYPYTTLYKANVRGAKTEWLKIVDEVEANSNVSLPALKYLITLLKQRSQDFQELVSRTMEKVDHYLNSHFNPEEIKILLFEFPQKASHSARLFEILIHSFYTALVDLRLISCYLKPLSQMRSANKKHGNIGDVELLKTPKSMIIIEAWDAKYGKTDLHDELEELKDKLEIHKETKLAGFITNLEPVMNKELLARMKEIESLFDVEIRIESIETWYGDQIEIYNIEDQQQFIKTWVKVFFEYLCLLRYDVAPIDEPTDIWIKECSEIL